MHFFHWLLDFHSTTAWSGTRSTSSSPMSLYISHQRSTEAEAPNPWSEWWSQRLRRFWPGKLIGNKSCCKSVPRSGSQLNLHVWEDDAHFGVSGDLSWASAVDIHVEGWLTPVDCHEGKRMQLRHVYIYIYSPQKPFPCDNVPKWTAAKIAHHTTRPDTQHHFSHDSYTRTTWEFLTPRKTLTLSLIKNSLHRATPTFFGRLLGLNRSSILCFLRSRSGLCGAPWKLTNSLEIDG